MQVTNRSERVTELIAQAGACLEQQAPGQAMLYIRQALALRPGEAKAHHMIGQVYMFMGKEILAQQAFHKARSLEGQQANPVVGQPQTLPDIAAPEITASERGPEADPQDMESFDVNAGIGRPDEDSALNHGQKRLVLDMTGQLLAQMAAIEQLMEEKGLAAGEDYATVHDARANLVGKMHAARDTWRAEQQVAAGSPLALPVPQAAYQDLHAITHTLGLAQGAVDGGEEVATLQTLLNREGLHVSVTGRYDTSTTLAVGKLQEKYHLSQRNGMVGGETRRLLNQLIGKA